MRKNLKRKLTGGIILAIAAFNLSGCGSNAQRKKQAEKALEQKYQEKFEITEYKDAGFMADYYIVQAYADAYPDLLFQASVDIESGSIMDAYVSKRLCDRISDKISQNIGTLTTDYYVFTEAMFENTLLEDPMATLEEYMRESPENEFVIYIFLDEAGTEKENISKSLKNMLNEIPGLTGEAAFYRVNSELIMNIQEYLASHDGIYHDFENMVSTFYVGFAEIENSCFFLREDLLSKMAGD